MPELLFPLFLPWIWSAARTRYRAGCIILLTYLVAAREEPWAVRRVLPELGPGAGPVLWVVHATSLALPWMLAWVPPQQSRAVRLLALLAILALEVAPPLGRWGWLHPLTLSGWLFPGWRAWGMLAMIGVVLALGLRSRWGLLGAIALSVCSNACYVPRALPEGWVGLDTRLSRLPNDLQSRMARQYHLMQDIGHVLDIQAAPPAVIVLPEEIAGPWTPAERYWWQPMLERLQATGTTLVLGAQYPDAGAWRNGALLTGDEHPSWQLARQPAPVAEWKPPAGALVDWGTGMATVKGKQVLFSFCFEDLLTLPILVTWLEGGSPEVMVSIANLWWATHLHEPDIQRLSITGWGRLWNAPVLRAVNLPD